MLTRNGTDGRVYGGDCQLIHIQDGKRRMMGAYIAAQLDRTMRVMAERTGARTPQEAKSQALCPGCYMIALVNAAVALAEDNGQPLSELGATMAQAFAKLATAEAADAALIEEIAVILD